MGTMTLKLTVTVKYEANGETQEELQEVLRCVPAFAAYHGKMTDDTAATVEDWTATVERIA